MPLLHLRNSEAVHEINLAPEEMDMNPEDMQADETRWTDEEDIGGPHGSGWTPDWDVEDEPS